MTAKQRVPVSVVIPCYRAVGTIRRAVESVMAQTALPSELILVEDASADDGATLSSLRTLQSRYEEYMPINIIEHKENQGLACARNTGWEAAQQHYIALLDADDLWHPQKLEIQYAWMHQHSHVAVSGCPYAWLRSHQGVPDLPSRWSAKRIRFGDLLLSNPFNASSVLLRHELPVRFQPSKRYCEDYLLWLLLARAGHEIYLLSLPLAYGYKPAFGHSGLAADLWAMEANELANYITLLWERMLSPRAWALATMWSMAKFLRRLMICSMKIHSI